jgi:tetratricopeptide (TPR) repeat protein
MATANPALQTLVAERAKALRDQGDHEGAKAEIDGFWSAYADRVSVDDLAALTEILADSEADADSVVADYGRLADEHPEAESWAYWVYRVVAALMREERRDEAEAWLDRLVDRRPQDLWRANAEVLVRPASVRNNIKPWTVAQGLDTPVRIDAVLDEPVWADRVTFRETVFLDDSKQPQNTEFAVARDSEALYLAVRALEPTPDAMVTRVDKPDRGVWSDDCIVIYLDPELDYKDYIQFIFNSAGTKWDGVADNRGQCSAAKLDAEVERRTVVGTDAWTLEVRIPFRELGIEAPSPGEVWGLGLQRWRHATGTLHTVWGNRRGTSHDNRPERFGFLQFAP